MRWPYSGAKGHNDVSGSNLKSASANTAAHSRESVKAQVSDWLETLQVAYKPNGASDSARELANESIFHNKSYDFQHGSLMTS